MAPCSSSSLSSPAIAAAILPVLGPALFSVSEPAVLTHAKQNSWITKKSRIKKNSREQKKKSRIKKRSRGQKKKSRIKKEVANKKKVADKKKEVADKKKKSRAKKKKLRIKKRSRG